jgi:hypothetical protein
MTWLALLFIACGGGDGAPPSSSDVTGAEPAKPEVKHPSIIDPGPQSGPEVPKVAVDQSECNAIESPAPDKDGVTGTIKCGETIKGVTRGGANKFNSKFYEKNFCTPRTTSHETGDERIYKFEMPNGPARAWVTLDTPCANLDLAVMKASGGGIPDGSSDLQQCEMKVKDGHTRERLELDIMEATTWWIVVEGQGEDEGAFAVTVQCEE